MLKRIKNMVRTWRERKRNPLHIEFNLTDYCNLNCKGCSHYSPLAPAEFEPLQQLEVEMKHIAGIKNVGLIRKVFLIGGETLLYPQLNEAIKLARKYFPGVKLSVFTNGLMIPKMEDEFWKVCRENDCGIALTRYPLKVDYDRIEQICRDKGVEVEAFGDRSLDNTFFRLPLDPRKKQNGRLAHFRCFSFGCITIDGGRIFPCSTAACVKHLNNRLGTEFKWERGDYIPIGELQDARQLLKLRNNPVPFCKYCRPVEPTKYGPSKRTVNEWVER